MTAIILVFVFVGRALYLPMLYSLNICHSISEAGLKIYLPPPASTGKQLLCLHWSFPVTNVNRQPIKETRETGAHRAQSLKNKNESADLMCSVSADGHLTLLYSVGQEGMCGRWLARCGSSFHLGELNQIRGEGKKLKDSKTRFLFNIVPARMYFLIQVQ